MNRKAILALGGICAALAGLPAGAANPSFAAAVGHRPMTLDAESSVMPLVVVLHLAPSGAPPATRSLRPAAFAKQQQRAQAALDQVQPLLDRLSASGHLAVAARFPALGVLVVDADARARSALSASPLVAATFVERSHRLVDGSGSSPSGPEPEAKKPPTPRFGLRSADQALASNLDPRRAAASGTNVLFRFGSTLEESGLHETSPAARWRPTSNVAATGAPRAWTELGATGQGVTVAILDSGVDWRHAALRSSYRGRTGDHDYAWIDVSEGAAEPIDPNGHGTHVAGLIAGREGDEAYGVAPGATWIAARAFDADGLATDRQLLAAAEWLLAPRPLRGGLPRPDLAPDVINGSWGLESSSDPLFEAVLSAWRTLGIVPVFAAGNDEAANPPGAVYAPASSPLALAVGALATDGTVRPDSRGGPGLSGGIKPDVDAPGTGTLSAEPGGGLGRRSGTSMAAPHVAGAAALVRGLDPSLGVDDVFRLLQATAADGGPLGPDDRYGWGRLDALAAAKAAIGGRLVGRVEPRDGGVTIEAQPEDQSAASTWPPARLHWDLSSGDVDMFLPLGRYRMVLGRFGYALATSEVEIVRGEANPLTVTLQPLPRQSVTARIRSAKGALPSAQVELVEVAPEGEGLSQAAGSRIPESLGCGQTPPILLVGRVIESAVIEDGRLDIRLPDGHHVLRVAAPGHRSILVGADVAGDAVDLGPICLPVAPNLAVVDADAWESADWPQERIAAFLGQPLDDAGYPHSALNVDNPLAVPDLGILARFDVVWWAHQFGSPGTLNRARGDTKVTEALAAYLAAGGRLILSGQDVGWRDAADGAPQYRLAPAFYRDVLGARLVADNTTDHVVQPAAWLDSPGPLARLDLTWPRARVKGFALRPDTLAGTDQSDRLADTLATYAPGGGVAALGLHGPRGRHVLLGFGPEGGGPRLALSQLMDGILGWLEPVAVDLRATPFGATATPFAVAPAEPLTITLGGTATLAAAVVAGRAAAAGQLVLDLPPALEPADPSPGWSAPLPGAPTWRFSDSFVLEARGSVTESLGVRLIRPLAGGEPLVITATATSDRRSSQATAQLWPWLPDLGTTTLAVEPVRLGSGGRVTATLRLANTGPATAGDLHAGMSWPLGFVPLAGSATASGGVARLVPGDSGQSVGLVWNGDLRSGEVVTISLAGDAASATGERLVFTGAITGANGSTGPWPTSSFSSTLLVGGPQLELPMGLGLPPSVLAGEPFVAEARLENRGLVTASATAALTLPPGIEPSPNAADLSYDSLRRRLVWQGKVGPLGSRLAIWPLVALGKTGGVTLPLVVEVLDGWSPPSPAPLRAEGAIRVRRALVVAEAALGPDGAAAGDWLTGRLTLANQGDAGTAIDVVDSLPARAQLDPASVGVSRGAITVSTATLRWALVLLPGEHAELAFRVQVGSGIEPNTALSHVARVRSGGDELLRQATAVAGRLTLDESSFTVSPTSPAPGGRLAYSLVLKAVGTAEARGATVRVRLPDGAALVAGSVAGGLVAAEDGTVLTWQGRLPAGGSQAFGWQMTVPVDLRPGARLSATAELGAKGVAMSTLLADAVTSSTDFAGSAKTVSRTVVESGETVTFTLRVRSGGPGRSQVAATDSLPAGLEMVPATLRSTGGNVVWDEVSRSLQWQDGLDGGQAALITFAARARGRPGDRIANVMALADDQGARARVAVALGIRLARVYLPAAKAP